MQNVAYTTKYGKTVYCNSSKNVVSYNHGRGKQSKPQNNKTKGEDHHE